MATVQQMIEADVSTLLMRALYNQNITGFGEDGLGRFGKSNQPKTFYVSDISFDVFFDDDTGFTHGTVNLELRGYKASDTGHLCTDQNFLISARKLLIQNHIDPNCLAWGSVVKQCESVVSLDIDVGLLLDWT